MRIPFFSKKNGKDRAFKIRNSNIRGDVSINSVGEGNDVIGLGVFNSNILGNVTVNYNGGTEALEKKIESILNNLRETIEVEHPKDEDKFHDDFEEVQNVVRHDPVVPSAIDSMEKLAKVLYKSGYYGESNQVKIDIAELLMETDSVISQIHGTIQLCRYGKSVDWFDPLRQALKLAVENDLEKETFLIHYHLFDKFSVNLDETLAPYLSSHTQIVKIGRDYTKNKINSRALLNHILSDISVMSLLEFKKNYHLNGVSGYEIVRSMAYYMESWESTWKKYDPNRFYSKGVVAKFEYLMKGYVDKRFVRSIKIRLLYPKLNFILQGPGVFWELFFIIFTLGRVSTPSFTLYPTKSWALTLIVGIGIWQFLI